MHPAVQEGLVKQLWVNALDPVIVSKKLLVIKVIGEGRAHWRSGPFCQVHYFHTRSFSQPFYGVQEKYSREMLCETSYLDVFQCWQMGSLTLFTHGRWKTSVPANSFICFQWQKLASERYHPFCRLCGLVLLWISVGIFFYFKPSQLLRRAYLQCSSTPKHENERRIKRKVNYVTCARQTTMAQCISNTKS